MYKIDIDNETLIIDNRTFTLEEYDEKTILWEPDLKAIHNLNFTIADYPEKLIINIQSEDGFETYLFYELEIYQDLGQVKIKFISSQPNKYWEGKYGLSTFLGTMNDIVKDCPDAKIEYIDIEDDYKDIEISFILDKDFVINDLIAKLSKRLNEIIKQTERVLSGVVWRHEYEKEEGLFCTELLYPLLRKMEFIDVRYTHGKKEYGKDFTFSEITKFGNLRHFGLQAKAGNLRGNVNAEIDEIIGQLNDAFSMPYYEVSANENRQISIFIVAISGNFTENAKEKIANKIPPYFKGCVYFIDREKTLELIEKYWK